MNSLKIYISYLYIIYIYMFLPHVYRADILFACIMKLFKDPFCWLVVVGGGGFTAYQPLWVI